MGQDEVTADDIRGLAKWRDNLRERRIIFNRRLAGLEAKVFKRRKELAAFLLATEKRYGGLVKGVPGVASAAQEHDGDVTHSGGDRMGAVHYYEPFYAKFLDRFVRSNRKIVLAEVGILRGTGCAIWSDLFPDGRIIGLDIFLGNIKANLDNLKQLGAFENANLELHEYDQFADNTELLAGHLQGDTFDIVIDDGCHELDPILQTARSMRPHLSDRFVYIIEDYTFTNSEYASLRKVFPRCRIRNYGEISFVTGS